MADGNRLHIHTPEVPIDVHATAVDVGVVGLCQLPGVPGRRVFVLLQFPGTSVGVTVQLSLEEAAFLRNAIDAVLARERNLADNAN